jgi:tol-pal system protein YbgF
MRFLAAVPLALTLCVPAAAAAQNREHQQLFADLRMLQEQVQRIQLALNTLGEQVEATNARLDAQDAATRKDFADQQYRIGLIDETLGTLREKLNDNTVRVSQLIQEVDAVREGIVVLQSLLNQILVQLTPMAEGDPDTAAGAPPSFGAPPGGFATDPSRPAAPPPTGTGADPPAMPPSPTASYRYAFGLYTSGDHILAIEAFRDFISRFPTAADAPKAQYFMGESLYQLGRYKEAIQAFQGVIATYPDSDLMPDAYFKQGLCNQSLRQNDEARRIYQLIITKFPDSTAAINAATALKGMGGGGVSNSL